MKLDKKVVQRRLDLMSAEGVVSDEIRVMKTPSN